MNSYPVQANSLVSQDPQAQAQSSAAPNRPALNGTAHVSALPQDTVTLSSSSKTERTATGEALATNATPNKPAAHTHPLANSPQKG